MTKRTQLIAIQDFGAAEQAALANLRAGSPVYASPFFAPGFIKTAASVRNDVRIAIYEDVGGIGAIMAYHKRPGRFVRPVGAPWADWQGPVVRPDCAFEPGDLLDRIGAQAMRLTGLADPFEKFTGYTLASAGSWTMDLCDGAAAYRKALTQQQGSNLSNTKRNARRAEREIGPITFVMNDPDRAAFDQLLLWKRQKFAETGSYDSLSVPWVQRFMDRLWEQRDQAFGGVLSTVRFGDRLAGATFHLRDGPRWATWIMGYDPELHAYGGGRILIDRFLDEADGAGVTALEFGPGGDSYKSKWCLSAPPVYEAVWHGRSAAGRMRAFARRGWSGVSRALGPANVVLTKARSRADHIAASQANWVGSIKGLAATITGRRPKLV